MRGNRIDLRIFVSCVAFHTCVNPIPKLTVYAKYLYYLMFLIVEITCFSQDVQLQSACSDKFLSIQNDRIFANQNTDNPQIFTIREEKLTDNTTMEIDIRLTFEVKYRGYICFNQKWQPRIMKKKNGHKEHSCVFREKMDRGYFTFSSVKDPQKFLGFMRNGRPINYSNLKHDEKCRLIYKKEIYRDSSNDVTSVTSPIIYQETSTTTPPQRKSSRMQKTHSNRIDSSKPSRNNKIRTHPMRHPHHNETLRHSHQQHNNNNNNINNNHNKIINNNNNNNNNLSNVNSLKDRISFDSNNDHDPYNNSVVNISDNPHHVRHHHGQHRKPGVDDEIDGGAPCDDVTGVNVVKGSKNNNNKKNTKKCNNRRNKKNNENAARHTRKKSSHKLSANRTPEN